MIPFADEYATALDELEEAKKQGTKAKKDLPAPVDLKELAQREGLNYEITPLLSRDQAEQFGPISGAEVGMARLSGGRKFADEFFDPKKALYEPEELTDLLGTRFLARKIKDVPPHVPPLDEVRSEVSLAWKMAKARPLAEKAAQELAEQLKKKGVASRTDTVEGYRVVTIPPIARRQTNFLASQFEIGPPEETPIPDVPYAGRVVPKRLLRPPARLGRRRAQPAPDRLLRHGTRPPRAGHIRRALCPQRRRVPLQDVRPRPGGPAARRAVDGLAAQQAGLKPDWVPPDEAKGKVARRGVRRRRETTGPHREPAIGTQAVSLAGDCGQVAGDCSLGRASSVTLVAHDAFRLARPALR